MPTKRRVWFPGCMYHITARGNHQEDIFKSIADFNMYLRMMKECLNYYEDCNYEVISYCLMRNHVHILVRAGKKEIGGFIRRLHSMYAMYFNNKYDSTGHLYQGRYYSEVIMDVGQLMEVSRYIHLNPVRAKIVKLPQQYKFSSYNMYIGKEEENIVDTSMILGYFPEEEKAEKKKERYRHFVEKSMEVS